MRALIALAIGVSVAACSFAESASVKIPANSMPAWSAVYQAGIAASRRHCDEEAVGFFEQSWRISDNNEERGISAEAIGQTERRLGRIVDARQWMERALEAFGADSKLRARFALTAVTLADIDRSAGDYGAAEHQLRAALASPSPDAETQAVLRNNLADLVREEGRSAEAQPLFEQSVADSGVSGRNRIGALIGLADIDREHAEWEGSVSRWNEALEISEREHDETAAPIILRGLGLTWLQSGSAARAEPLLRRSVRLMEANPDMPPEEMASAHSALAELYRSENKLALAENEWTNALAIDRRLLGDSHPQVAILMEMLSEVYSVRGEFPVARDYAARALDTMRNSFGETSMPVAAALTNQAGVEQRARHFDAAARHFEDAIRIARSHPEHRSLQMVMIERYAGLLKAMHRPREARALLAERDAQRNSPPVSFPVK